MQHSIANKKYIKIQNNELVMEKPLLNRSAMIVLQPLSLKESLKLLNENPDAEVIANASDLWPRIRNGEVKPKKLLDISGLAGELSYVKKDGNLIKIGALVTVSQLEGESILKEKRFSGFKDVIAKFGSPQIRNVATIGGNVCAASSSEDFIPLLLAFNAKVKLSSVDGERYVNLEKFIIGKRKINRRPNEILTEISFEDPGEGYSSAFEKIGRRNTLIINIVNMAVVGKVKDGKIEDVRIAANRIKGKIPERAKNTEEFLKGKALNEETIAGAKKVLSEEVSLTDFFRASAEYRKALLLAMLERLLFKLRGEQ